MIDVSKAQEKLQCSLLKESERSKRVAVKVVEKCGQDLRSIYENYSDPHPFAEPAVSHIILFAQDFNRVVNEYFAIPSYHCSGVLTSLAAYLRKKVNPMAWNGHRVLLVIVGEPKDIVIQRTTLLADWVTAILNSHTSKELTLVTTEAFFFSFQIRNPDFVHKGWQADSLLTRVYAIEASTRDSEMKVSKTPTGTYIPCVITGGPLSLVCSAWFALFSRIRFPSPQNMALVFSFSQSWKTVHLIAGLYCAGYGVYAFHQVRVF